MKIPMQDAYLHAYIEFLGVQLIYINVCLCMCTFTQYS